MFANSEPVNNPSSTPVSAATTPAASPITLPSEAAALLQSLLQDNNIMTSSINPNTFSRDFCLFEADEAQFDYPLFESHKMQSQHSLHSLQQSHALQQHVQQQQLQQQHVQQQQAQAQHLPNTNSNPLCTPQTPSLDFPVNVRATESYGFDSFSTFFEDPASSHSSTSAPVVALIHVNDIDSHNGIGGANSADLTSFHFTSSHSHALLDTPFTPYLDTPFETPYLSDFGDESEITNSAQILFGHDHNGDRGRGDNNVKSSSGSGDYYGSIPLFHDFDFEIPVDSLERSGYNNTIEPSTLFMASPVIQQESEYSQESDSSCSLSDSSSAPVSPVPHCKATFDGLDNEDLDASSSSNSPDYEYGEYEDEEDEDEVDDENDGDFIPSRPMATASSGSSSSCKRKAPTTQSGRNIGSINKFMATASPNKRTRPELAGPFGGKKKRSPKVIQPTLAKRFPCNYPGCELRFARLYNLHTHERTHDPDQVRPFVCSAVHCRKAFSRKHDLQRHEASVHKGERNWKCPTCSKPFSRQDGLRRHVAVKGSICAIDDADIHAGTGRRNEPRWSTT
ncbi:hypothetical protein BGZ46_007880 [Entomortierella lignicola]|nr:hypothetical protein BGZ46_007880 [Entomortierella lignicola]